MFFIVNLLFGIILRNNWDFEQSAAGTARTRAPSHSRSLYSPQPLQRCAGRRQQATLAPCLIPGRLAIYD
eukprot:6183326-Pleurochrysis_carterae.AAC.2